MSSATAPPKPKGSMLAPGARRDKQLPGPALARTLHLDQRLWIVAQFPLGSTCVGTWMRHASSAGPRRTNTVCTTFRAGA